jgi:hypothetical protein
MKTRYMGRIVREAIEIELHPYNINREGGFCLSKSWKPLIGSLKLSEHDPKTLGDAVPTLTLTFALFIVPPLHRGYEISLCSHIPTYNHPLPPPLLLYPILMLPSSRSVSSQRASVATYC